jgi:hypothetical protein
MGSCASWVLPRCHSRPCELEAMAAVAMAPMSSHSYRKPAQSYASRATRTRSWGRNLYGTDQGKSRRHTARGTEDAGGCARFRPRWNTPRERRSPAKERGAEVAFAAGLGGRSAQGHQARVEDQAGAAKDRGEAEARERQEGRGEDWSRRECPADDAAPQVERRRPRYRGAVSRAACLAPPRVTAGSSSTPLAPAHRARGSPRRRARGRRPRCSPRGGGPCSSPGWGA